MSRAVRATMPPTWEPLSGRRSWSESTIDSRFILCYHGYVQRDLPLGDKRLNHLACPAVHRLLDTEGSLGDETRDHPGVPGGGPGRD